ncbi:hypothetical protein BDK51DRAFT_32069 [Blyttiomyces helicus]|uniref:G-protein coupled receptors family 2 profile 2 domain-containing protein n=1 Tax=Blyttiomyces helicus TaxID=388810 RepID=A0A4P9W3L1_9FUNG|nr:hypothetical protein BDK51DRAFT_32069 [Blyttiomyces helicus]|eukprot:RKO85885.1 hypothetical protein BDK51DRAFT_32069 [Blyttiomyces helicus]
MVSSFYETHHYVTYVDWQAVHHLALVAISLSLVGSLYIIISTLLRWRRGGYQPLSTTQLFPMWISCCDLLYGLFHGSDHIINLVTEREAPKDACVALGALTVFAMALPAVWVAACAFNVWASVVWGKTISYGRYDWKLHVIGWGFPAIWAIIPLIKGQYGAETFWCGLPDPLYLFIFNGIPVSIAIAADSILYGHVVFTLLRYRNVIETQSIRSPLPSDTVGKARALKLESRARSLPTFVMIYMIQWAPYLGYQWCMILSVQPVFSYALVVVVLANLGGLMNAIAYRRLLNIETHSEGKMSNDVEAMPKFKMSYPETSV